MASAADLDRWKEAGGKLEESKSGKRATKTWIAPNGKRFRSWKDAAAFLESSADAAKGSPVRKRVQASPDVAKDEKEGDKKRQKKAPAKPRSAGKKAAAAAADAAAADQPASDDEMPDAAPAPAAADAAADAAASGDDEAAAQEDKSEAEASSEEEGGDSEAEDEAENEAPIANGAPRAVGSGRRAAQNVHYKEVSDRNPSKKDQLQAKSEPDAKSEQEALQETQTARSGTTRRLLHFTIVDAAGELQSLDRMGLLKEPLKLTGAVYPEEGPLNKADGRRLVAPFGPITRWYIAYEAAGATPVAVTAAGSYRLSKPAPAYRKTFAALEEQACLAWHAVQAVDESLGGSASASLDSVVTKVARAKAAKGYPSAREALLLNGRFLLGQLSAYEARKSGASANDKGKAKAAITAGTFYKELEAELAKGPVRVGVTIGHSIKISDNPEEASGAAAAAANGDGEAPDALMAADEDMARRLQAKMDAQSLGGGKARGGGGRGRVSAANAYIKISEFEIADDYPMPQQYKAAPEVEETDELVMWDEEMVDMDPELLPKRLLTDFTIYNAEGFFASLELLPMWSGVDPDVELFASGIVKDDEGDWGTGGQPIVVAAPPKPAKAPAAKGKAKAKAGGSGAAEAEAAAGGSSAAEAAGGGSGSGSGSAAAAAEAPAEAGAAAAEDGSAAADAEAAVGEGPDPVAEGGMRLFLSQIREWVVEFSADTLFISIRTDAAWYKLCRPNPKYAPWYGVPLKSARVAVSVINRLAAESRASRLSFTDVCKRLAEEEPGSGTFISKKLDRVERFLVVHGQIVLNQIKAYPSKDVQRSPFVSSLKEKMEARRHSKLYYSKRGFSKAPSRGVNRNPMKDRSGSGRPKPMPATATTMVRSVWQNYFYEMEEQQQQQLAAAQAAAAAADGDAAAAEVAKEVEDDPLEEEQQEEEDDQEEALAAGMPSSPAGRRRKAKAKAAAAAKGKAKAGAAAAGGSSDGAGSSRAAEAAAANGNAPAAPVAKKVTWVGASTSSDDEGRTFYATANVGPHKVAVGSVVLLEGEASEAGADAEGDAAAAQPVFGLVQCMWQDEDGDKLAQVRLLVLGAETVLGDAASGAELFVTDEYEEINLPEVVGLADAKRLEREFDAEQRVAQFGEDEALRKRNAAAKAAGKPLQYFYRHLYLPQRGMFAALPAELGLGTRVAPPAPPVALGFAEGGGFIKDGVEYKVGDLMFVDASVWEVAAASESGASEDEADEAASDKDEPSDLPAYASKKSRYHKGSCAGLKAWGLGRLVEVKQPAAAGGSGGGRRRQTGGAKSGVPTQVRLQRFYRPEDVGKDEAYRASFWDVYASPAPPASGTNEWVQWVDVSDVIRKCAARGHGAPLPEGAEGLECFVVKGTYDPAAKTVSGPPEDYAAAAAMDVDGDAAAAAAAAQQQQRPQDGHPAVEPDSSLALATMDIFAGCGGLSEGMHQAHVADTRWAIEYESPAAEAFRLNNPGAAVFCNNCNVILLAAMKKAGLESDCSACEDCCNAAAGMPAEEVARLPLPGEVEFIMGGPPCQGYSGMNRFNKGNWSMVQNSMVMAFLSFADFYRPRYFLLENVRNFVSHNKSFTFRLTLRTLLDMGYQVRFGVLNAGNYGVPQSRKRTFIWAAAPDELLPDWPRPRHVFRSPQLTVNLPGGVAYCAVDTSLPPGAPLRTVTVRDAIGDLPAIENGHDADVMEYSRPPESAFQGLMRGRATQLQDHICKEMNPLNLERCRCIPKDKPGADWRVLLEIVKNDPSREKFNGQPLVPWCLPNTAERHNGWRGLFGRLDLAGHFPTSTTDPQPMGKVGQVFHPNQDRIVSVRECARSQGFPDHFHFSGNVHARHRQVGNAVPPPLAASLGRQLYSALAKTKAARMAELEG